MVARRTLSYSSPSTYNIRLDRPYFQWSTRLLLVFVAYEAAFATAMLSANHRVLPAMALSIWISNNIVVRVLIRDYVV